MRARAQSVPLHLVPPALSSFEEMASGCPAARPRPAVRGDGIAASSSSS